MTQPILVPYVILVPTSSTGIPAGALFIDAGNGNQLSLKDTNGIVGPVGSGGGGGQNMLIKPMIAGEVIAVNRPLSKRADGKVVDADTDAAGRQNFIGYSLTASGGDGATINVLCIGPNLAGAITGMGFTPGQDIFLGESGGYTNNTNTFTGNNDSIIKVGVADCAAGVASAVATDLLVFAEVVVRP